MARYLDEIIAWHRARAAGDTRDMAELKAAAREALSSDPVRPFAAALTASPAISVIAEIKRRSPSKGDLAPRLQPALVARAYEAGGAACLSVLTDGPHFGGSPDDLTTARQAVSIPVLRKDFTVCVADVYDARIMGADAVLLIVAALADDELAELAGAAEELEMAAVVEVHDEAEAQRALTAGAKVVGVNQRDLHTFEVDPERARAVGRVLPAPLVRIAESGVTSPAQMVELAAAGFDGALVGETLVTADDPVAALQQLTHLTRSAAS